MSIALVSMALGTGYAAAQGCVAAHSVQKPFDELISTRLDKDALPGSRNSLAGTGESMPARAPRWEDNLTIDIGYRVFNSNKYFQGSNEIARPTAVRNHENIFDVGVEYRLSPRWSLIADVPVFNGSRDQIYPPTGKFFVSGVGDITVGAQSWLFRPPTENGGNIAVNVQLKIPTGKDNYTGTGIQGGKTVIATADQSLQPGDGTWGFSVGTQAYKQLWHSASLYTQANYLLSPADTNGVATFRSQPGQGIMSATDQYLYRGGILQRVPKIRRLAFTAGVRGEGVPVRDLIGKSDGFRRPGFIFSFDPGVMFSYKRDTITVNGPWAIYRDRPPSVPEIQYNIVNGDAFFGDYTVIANWSHHF
jgi:hypothetical protein